MVGLRKPTVSEVCDRVKRLGYATGSQIHIYGERLEVVSDPFPHENGIAIRARAKDDTAVRIISLPSTVLHAARKAA